MKKEIKYDDNLEKILTAVFGIIGALAILINLHLKGYSNENVLDAVKDIAGIVVVIAVFLVANNIFKSFSKQKGAGFNEKFEKYLIDWAEQNKYLIDATSIDIEKGQEGKRTIKIIVNHKNFVTGTIPASATSEKGAFLYLPSKINLTKDEIMYFKINKGMFKQRADFDYDKEKNTIIEQMATRINFEFGNQGIIAKKSSESEKIEVNFANLEKTDENAKKLIDLVEFVKTMYLAIA